MVAWAVYAIATRMHFYKYLRLCSFGCGWELGVGPVAIANGDSRVLESVLGA
jgi:hypothetical protein